MVGERAPGLALMTEADRRASAWARAPSGQQRAPLSLPVNNPFQSERILTMKNSTHRPISNILGYGVIFGVLFLVLAIVGGTLVSPAFSAALVILLQQMQGLKRVGEAWVVRKHVEHFPEDPALVILFRPTLLGSAKKLSAWMVAVLKCPAPTFFLAQSGVRGKVAQQIKSVGVRLI